MPNRCASQFEDRYVEAIRLVGSKYLAAGEIPTAWAYFRVIAEPEPVKAAIDAYQPDQDAEKLGQVIEVAFNQGANPRRGFELILEHYGTCPAITALEQLPSADAAVQRACIEKLVRHLHTQLAASIRADLAHRGEVVPAEATTIAELIAGRDWLFADEGYHTDISHLSATVRYSTFVSDPAILALAADLADYGRRLSPRLQFEGTPPFEQVFADHHIYFRGMMGQDVDAAISHFRKKLDAVESPDLESSMPAQVLVNLLVRVGRLDEAIDVAAARLAHLPEQALTCPGLPQLCQQRGRMDRLAEVARQQGDLVHFLAARLNVSDAGKVASSSSSAVPVRDSFSVRERVSREDRVVEDHRFGLAAQQAELQFPEVGPKAACNLIQLILRGAALVGTMIPKAIEPAVGFRTMALTGMSHRQESPGAGVVLTPFQRADCLFEIDQNGREQHQGPAVEPIRSARKHP